MSEQLVVHAQKREVGNSSSARRLRRGNFLPAVIYGLDGGAVPVQISYNDLIKMAKEPSFFTQLLTVKVDGGKEEMVVLKELQRHPSRPRFLHADFQRVRIDQKISVRIPIEFVGADKCVGVKVGGGLLSHTTTELEISCLPGDLPEKIEVNVENLQLGESIHISDVQLPANVQSVDLERGEGHDLVVASVVAPRMEEEEPVAAEEEEEGEAAEEKEGEGDGEQEGGAAKEGQKAQEGKKE